MSFPRGLLAVTLGFAAGCASATAPENQGQPDANSGPGIDAPEQPGIDAPVAPPVDAPPGPCTTMTRQLLANENFDATPEGTGWTAAPIDPAYPIITTDDGNSGVVEHSPTRKAWLGGAVGAIGGAAADNIYQDIAVPAGTTDLVITGQHWTKSSETSTTTAYDTVKFTVEQGATVISTVYSGGSNVRHTAWQALNHTVPNAASLAGQTIRLKLASTNDFSSVSSFWFDTLALTATYCQ